jgi:phosphatidylethanolamine-binding protein (PEBP) family uncharacterized protein
MITKEINKTLNEWNEKTPSDIGVGYGFKQTNGVYTDEICIVFSVKEKKPLSELSEDEVLPSQININENKTISTDVIQVGEIYALQCSRTTPITNPPPICEPFILTAPTNRSAFATLKGGISITSVRKASSVGTLGMIVQDIHTNALVGLTNNHVVVGNSIKAQYQNLNPFLGNNFPITNEINPDNTACQPGEFGFQPNLSFGQVIRYVPIVPHGTILPNGSAVTPTNPNLVPLNNVDAALVSVDCNKIDFNQSWKFSGFESLMTSPLPFATTAEIDNLLVTNPQLYSTGRSTGPKGLGMPGCELRIHQLNVATTVGGYSWHLASGNQQYGTSASFNPRLIAFYKPSGVPAEPHCLWPCAAGDSGSMLIANLGTQATPIFKIIGLVFAGNSLPSYPVAGGAQNVFNTNFSALYQLPTNYVNWLGFACRIDDVANELGIKAWTGGNAPLVNPQSISLITLPGLNSVTATTCQNEYYYQVGTTMTQSVCGAPPSVILTSPQFLNGQTLSPVVRHPNCGGNNYSVGLDWFLNNITTNDVISYSLLMEDINAGGTSPNGYFVHWKVANIPPTQTAINLWTSGPTGWQAGATIQQTDWFPSPVNPNGYGGPCPPGHTYRISITVFLTPAAGGGSITSNLLTFISS